MERSVGPDRTAERGRLRGQLPVWYRVSVQIHAAVDLLLGSVSIFGDGPVSIATICPYSRSKTKYGPGFSFASFRIMETASASPSTAHCQIASRDPVPENTSNIFMNHLDTPQSNRTYSGGIIHLRD